MLQPGAFLEVNGRPVSLTQVFKIGRSTTCALTLDDDQASREHAMIARDEARSAWFLLDLDSTNGTRLNGNLIARATLLGDGDEIHIGSHCLRFHDVDGHPHGPSPSSHETQLIVGTVARWLLLADLKGSTRLSEEIPQDELSRRIRRWVATCETIIDAAGGWVNEYLGDGFLAAWKPEAIPPARMVEVLRVMQRLPSDQGLDFRFVVHRAEIQSGGGLSNGLEKLAGRELNFLFKAEKAVKVFDRRLVLTRAATAALDTEARFTEVGTAEVAGFLHTEAFFAIDPTNRSPGSSI